MYFVPSGSVLISSYFWLIFLTSCNFSCSWLGAVVPTVHPTNATTPKVKSINSILFIELIFNLPLSQRPKFLVYYYTFFIDKIGNRLGKNIIFFLYTGIGI